MTKHLVLILTLTLISCTKQEKPELWVYTSLYKDTLADIQPALDKQFPEVKVMFFQAGSEEISSKVNAESLAGGIKADVIIASDRFWYEEMARQGKFLAYKPKGSDEVSDTLKNKDDYYTTASLPVMVLAYNNQEIKEKDIPKTFKEMQDLKWKGKFTTGSPLASGTNFTTVASLQKKYGWDYFKKLRQNDTISEGGNSAVLRRIQTKERPIGWVLLENVLRFQDKDPNVKVIYPEDGSLMQINGLAIIKKSGDQTVAKKFADWIFTKEGQEAMIKWHMHSPIASYPPPKGALPLTEIQAKATPWTLELLEELMKSREEIKEQFTKIMFQ